MEMTIGFCKVGNTACTIRTVSGRKDKTEVGGSCTGENPQSMIKYYGVFYCTLEE